MLQDCFKQSARQPHHISLSAKLSFPLPTLSIISYPQQTAGSMTASCGGTVMDREVRSDAASPVQYAATFPWKLWMAGTYPASK